MLFKLDSLVKTENEIDLIIQIIIGWKSEMNAGLHLAEAQVGRAAVLSTSLECGPNAHQFFL